MGFPRQFTNWIMIIVTTVSYHFNVNGKLSTVMPAKRGLRQGYPISSLLFVLVMEYLNRCLHQLQHNLNFNYHSKCEKMKITNLSFADDLLLFARGDALSVELMMKTFMKFSYSTSLKINPNKC